jgi:GAF domain-containing protein
MHYPGRAPELQYSISMASEKASRIPTSPSKSFERSQFRLLDQAASRLLLLAEVNQKLSGALTDDECFKSLLALMVPVHADWATLTLINEQKEIWREVSAHRDPEKAEVMSGLGRQYSPRIDDASGPGRVMRTGESEFDAEYGSHLAEEGRTFRYPELVRLLEEIGIRSQICVPLGAHGQILGALWLATSRLGRRFGREDLILAEQVASRAALAAYNLIQYEKASDEIERLKIAMKARQEYLAQLRHDALSALTPARLSAQMIEQGIGNNVKVYANRILTSIDSAMEILKKSRDVTDSTAPLPDCESR